MSNKLPCAVVTAMLCAPVSGQVFKARVRQVLPAIVGGQLRPAATLIEFRENTEAGRVAVLLDLEDPAIKQHELP